MQTVVVMGVSGAGKSTVGPLLAKRLNADFAEADSFHPAVNIAKMTAGIPLEDADRLGWLRSISEWIHDHYVQNQGCVVACSALKVAHRDILRQGSPDVFFAHLGIDSDNSKQRVARRTGHFLPASLVSSQFDALETLNARECGGLFNATLPPDILVEAILEDLDRR